jgi:4-carboxymuconolactone decarboxylase
LSPAQAILRDAITQSPRGAQMVFEGPFGVWMHSAEIGNAAQNLGQKVRYEGALPPRLSELAILICARHWRAAYEWQVHAPIAARAGLAQSIIADIAAGVTPSFQSADEAAVYHCALNVVVTSRMPRAVYDQGLKQLGEAALVDLVALLGYYTLVAFTLNVFEVDGSAPWCIGEGSDCQALPASQ